MANEHRDQKTLQLIKDTAARYVQEISNRISLITVTGVLLADRAKQATILITVLPEHKEAEALDFLKRKRSEFQEYFRTQARMGRVPLFDFKIDRGEKHRQILDNLLA